MGKKIRNILIVLLVGVGLIMTFTHTSTDTQLLSKGFENLKYFTVLSNIFAGIVALVALFTETRPVKILKLMSAAATGLTFAVIAFFLGPLYGHIALYQGANLLFHLIVPILCMVDYVLLEDMPREKRYVWLCAIPPLLYGTGYILNILINGIGGEYPDTNDFYLFLNWGWGVGIVIFLGIALATIGIAALLQKINGKIEKRRDLKRK